jgi:sugar (pentulose or hexulose) kinase
VRVERRTDPDESAVEAYAEGYRRFRALYPAVKDF